MDLQDYWEKALRNTEVIRPRIQPLQTFAATHLPYIFLAESAVNPGDTVVRRGEVLVEKPSIILPQNMPQFEGFESEEDKLPQSLFADFLFVRGIRFPSLRYNNKTFSLDVHEGRLSQSIEHFRKELERAENISAGLVMGPEDCWQFSVIIFVCTQILKSAEGDIQRMMDDFKKRNL